MLFLVEHIILTEVLTTKMGCQGSMLGWSKLRYNQSHKSLFCLHGFPLTFKHLSRKNMIIDSATACLLQGGSEANRIFYLSVPQEALLDVACSLSDYAQTQKGWNRIIIEKPFGFDALSSQQLTKSLLSKYEEKQIYRCLYTI